MRLSTVGDIRLIATRARGVARGVEGVEFRLMDGTLVAVHSLGAVHQSGRLFSVKPEQPDWILGPVETARLRAICFAARGKTA
jgi:hypothetical protein